MFFLVKLSDQCEARKDMNYEGRTFPSVQTKSKVKRKKIYDLTVK